MNNPADKPQCFKCGHDVSSPSLYKCKCEAKQSNETAQLREWWLNKNEKGLWVSNLADGPESIHVIEAAPVLAMIAKLEEEKLVTASRFCDVVLHLSKIQGELTQAKAMLEKLETSLKGITETTGGDCYCQPTENYKCEQCYVDEALAELAAFRGLTNGETK